MIYVGISTHYSKAKDIVDELLLKDLKTLDYSLQDTANKYGISVHTQKKKQSEVNWNLAVKQVNQDLKDVHNVLITEKVNNQFILDALPNSIRFIASSNKLDAVLSLHDKLDLNYNFTEEYFDRKINSLLSSDRIIYFNTDNNWEQLGEILQIPVPKPFYVIKSILLNESTLEQAWEDIKRIHRGYSSKDPENKTQKIINTGAIHFDLDSIFSRDVDKYKEFFVQLNLKSSQLHFTSVINNYQKYVADINTLYKEFLK